MEKDSLTHTHKRERNKQHKKNYSEYYYYDMGNWTWHRIPENVANDRKQKTVH